MDKKIRAVENAVSIFYLDRPQVANAMDAQTAALLGKEVNQAVKKNEVGMIISSRHPRVFCAGGDLRAYSKMKSKAQGLTANRQIRKILQGFNALPLFVVAAVEGEVIGGGCELALACDWIISSTSATFSFKQVQQHLTTGWGGAQRLLKRTRPSLALDWLTSGRTISAQEAFRGGLVDQLCAGGDTVDEARRFLSQRAHLTPQLLKAYKNLVSNSGHGEERIFDKFWFAAEHRKALKNLS